MKLPGEELDEKFDNIKAKKQILISQGNLSVSNPTEIDINFSLYDKIILEIGSGTMTEGSSYIIEVDEDGTLVNRGVNFMDYADTAFNCYGFFYFSNTNKMTLKTKSLNGWNNRNYYIKGILKN